MSQAIFCPACGEKVNLSTEYETKFCPYCGGSLPTLSGSNATESRNPVPAGATDDVRASKETQESISEEPVPMNSEPFHLSERKSHSGSGFSSPAVETHPDNNRSKLIVRWYLAIIAWAAAFAVLLYIAEEVFMNLAIGTGLLLLFSMPFWYTRFHPDAKRRKGVALKWSVIMIILMVLIGVVITVAVEL